MKQPVIIAHRGASTYAPENTMASFNTAIKSGAGGIELDVQMTLDEILVVIHDERVDRTSDGSGWIKEKTFNELLELDFGSWFSPEFRGERIPSLEQVMELLSNWHGLLNIEIKNGPVFYPGIEDKVSVMIKRFGMEKRTIVSSFNHYSLLDIKKSDPDIKTGILYMAGLVEPWEYAKRLGAESIHPLFYNIVPDILKGCRDNGIAINPFTIDQPEYIAKIAAAGVDGIITNVPQTALEVLKRMGEIK